MRRQCLITIQPAILGALCCLALIACASFPGGDLPSVTYQQIVPHDPKPPMEYEAVLVQLGGTTHTRMTVAAVRLKAFQDTINKVFSQSNMFSGLNAVTGFEKYHITLVLQNKHSISFPYDSDFDLLSPAALSLAVFPAYDKHDCLLTVQVKKGDQLLRQYQYRQRIYTWYQFPLMFLLMPTNAPGKVERKVIENMLLNFLYDSQKDKIWEVLPNNVKDTWEKEKPNDIFQKVTS